MRAAETELKNMVDTARYHVEDMVELSVNTRAPIIRINRSNFKNAIISRKTKAALKVWFDENPNKETFTRAEAEAINLDRESRQELLGWFQQTPTPVDNPASAPVAGRN